ncbi:MAG: RNA-binding S4 domain-containing protein [Rhodocyclaceae bacterium]|nr:RNA-binding S4 domain-containing protein [Rhodocyclaceae bacterium]
MPELLQLRIDKWLWAARFFKTRSLAALAVTSHKVKWNGDHTKASREVKIGDELEITSGEQRFVVVVMGVSELRRPAPEARQLYAETPSSLDSRLKQQELRRLAPMPGANLRGRPTKKAGRLIRGITG